MLALLLASNCSDLAGGLPEPANGIQIRLDRLAGSGGGASLEGIRAASTEM
jgi:hypothetical protein